ncbi:hypothetical protein ACGF12_22885 [Kitasatospora sp. NPDC048296]|uniref:hypothetical protein n=1 Tax=Kitasatospora sp. NPDC048296 TaxID=3364048 RepID=UPI003719FD8A
MNEQELPGRQARRPLAQPFSHAAAAADQPIGERLMPAERLAQPFTITAAEAADPDRPPGRRKLGPGGLAAQRS